jgi:hypothetical protein
MEAKIVPANYRELWVIVIAPSVRFSLRLSDFALALCIGGSFGGDSPPRPWPVAETKTTLINLQMK